MMHTFRLMVEVDSEAPYDLVAAALTAPKHQPRLYFDVEEVSCEADLYVVTAEHVRTDP